jgi:hypothetical protein
MCAQSAVLAQRPAEDPQLRLSEAFEYMFLVSSGPAHVKRIGTILHRERKPEEMRRWACGKKMERKLTYYHYTRIR